MPAPKPSPVLTELARRYRRRHAGRTGRGQRAVTEDLEDLLQAAGCAEGEVRARAEAALRDAALTGVLEREPHHPRDPEHIARIRLRPEQEDAFFTYLGEPSPAAARQALAAQIDAVRNARLPERWQSGWTAWLDRLHDTALGGGPMEPLDREPSPLNAELLALLPALLSWEGESLIRFASCVLCGESKRLETLSSRLSTGLADITSGAVRSLDDLGIVRNPCSVLVHGPLRLQLPDGELNLGLLRGPCRLSEADIAGATALHTSARRCLTVENETTFHELAKLRSGELLIQTSFPGSAVLALLGRLPDTLEYHHFGDSDDAGFAILDDLRARSGRDIHPLHMERGRVPFEQESLGRPTLATWPFYPLHR